MNHDNCEKFLKGTALQFGRIKAGNDKLPADDKLVTDIYKDLKEKVSRSSGPKIKAVVSSMINPLYAPITTAEDAILNSDILTYRCIHIYLRCFLFFFSFFFFLGGGGRGVGRGGGAGAKERAEKIQ